MWFGEGWIWHGLRTLSGGCESFGDDGWGVGAVGQVEALRGGMRSCGWVWGRVAKSDGVLMKFERMTNMEFDSETELKIMRVMEVKGEEMDAGPQNLVVWDFV